jgi:hypothetical protein
MLKFILYTEFCIFTQFTVNNLGGNVKFRMDVLSRFYETGVCSKYTDLTGDKLECHIAALPSLHGR